jgi:methylglutamate dehydrogenase subunit B
MKKVRALNPTCIEGHVRIVCPYCGERGNEEFNYLGDASLARPDPTGMDATGAFSDYVYVRDNPRGLHREYWQHVAGCRSWLIVTRDTVSHQIADVAFAHNRAGARPPQSQEG